MKRAQSAVMLKSKYSLSLAPTKRMTTQMSTQQSTLMSQSILRVKTIDSQLNSEVIEEIFSMRCQEMKLGFNPLLQSQFVEKILKQSQQGALNLQKLSLTPKCLPLISKLLTDIVSLDLSQNNIFKSPPYLSSLISLTLSNCSLDPQAFVSLFNQLKQNNMLISLNVGNYISSYRNRLGLQGSIALNSLLKHNKILQILNFRNCGITTKMLQVMDIQNGESLVHLDLAYNELRGLLELKLPPNLMWLELEHNQIGNDGLINIASQLQFGGLDIDYLNIANNRLNDFGLDEIFQYLERNINLHKLILDNNIISNEFSTSFLQTFFAKNSRLEYVSFQNCSLDIQWLSKGMQKNSRIKTLDLTKNPLSQQNISELLNGRMEQLILRRCGITDEVGQPFFIQLLQFPNIRKIDISENLLGDSSAFLALRNSKQNKFLIELNIEKNLITYQLQIDIQHQIQENQYIYKQQLIPKLKSQVSKFGNFENQQAKIDQEKDQVFSRKIKVQQQFHNVRDSFDIEKMKTMEKTNQTQDKLENLKEELKIESKIQVKLEKESWLELQNLDEQINNLKQQIQKEQQQSAIMEKKKEELEQESRNINTFFKQKTNQLKIQLDSMQRKCKTSQAEYESFQKQLNLIKQQMSPTRKDNSKKSTIKKV